MSRISIYAITLMLIMSFAQAIVYVNSEADYAIVQSNGVLTKTSTPVNQANFVGYTCLNSACTSVGSQIFNVNTGSDNHVITTYPTVLQSTYGYLIWVHKDDYIPWYYQADWRGTGTAPGTYSKYLSQKEGCHAPINEFTVLNEVQPNIPLIIDVEASLDATTHSALRCNYDVHLPNYLVDDLSTEVRVVLEIYDDDDYLIHTETKYLDIFCSTAEQVQFSWTPTEKGNYQAYVKTLVTDAKCISSTEDQASKYFHVLSDEPRNMCYTLLNALTMDDPFPAAGDEIEFSGTKLSNYADNHYDLHPIATMMTYEIYDRDTAQLVFYDTELIAANNNNYDPEIFDFNWDTSSNSMGYYDLYVTGVAQDPICNGLENLNETLDLGFFLDGPVNEAPSIDGLPDKTTYLGAPAQNRWIDLRNYASDPENDPLTFRIISESNTGVIDCYIDSDYYVSCDAPLQTGSTHIIVEVWDGEYTDRDDFYVTVTSCQSGDTDSRQCGSTDVGECSLGTQTRFCDSAGYWSDWSSCQGAVYPIDEVCDGLDNDCDGYTDENLPDIFSGTDVGECQRGIQSCVGGDYIIVQPEIGPTEEICDGLDNDCDGYIDEGGVCGECTPGESQERACGTDIGVCEFGTQLRICFDNGQDGGIWGSWSACVGGVDPSEEICDGLDNDCDTYIDENLPDIFTGTNVGECQQEIQSCVEGDYIIVQPEIVPSEEICDGLDNDCDGYIDEGVCGPTIECIPNQYLDENSGFHDDLEHLPDYASDPNNNVEDLIYTLDSETRTDIVDCSIDSGNDLDCDVQPDMTGVSLLNIRVSDGSLFDTTTCKVVVNPVNTAPTINIPDHILPYNSGFHNNMIDLWVYADDDETIDPLLDFTLVSQTNPEIVECLIDNDQFVDCTVKPFISGDSYVTIEVTDGELTAVDTFKITVQEAGGDITVQVLYPNGGELLRGTVDILWNAYSTHVCPADETIKLEYKHSGLDWVLIADNEANDGTYAWDTTQVEDQATYLIKVTAADCAGSAYDVSNGFFTVANRKAKEDKEIIGDYELSVWGLTLFPDEIIDPSRDELLVFVAIENTGDFDLDNVKVTGVMPELALRDSFGPRNIDKGDYEDDVLYFDIPASTEPGEYVIRFTFSNGDVKRVKHRYIQIV